LSADVLVRVHSAVEAFNPDGGAKLTTWIFRIAHNLGVDWVRRQQRLAVKGIAAGALDDAAEKKIIRGQVNDWYRDWIAPQTSQTEICTKPPVLAKKIQCMKRARAALTENDLGLIELRLTMSNREIADAEGVPEGTIRTRYSRAVARLTAAYEREMNL
jgi:RNA polymerase sigma factor (sigma-70 family)